MKGFRLLTAAATCRSRLLSLVLAILVLSACAPKVPLDTIGPRPEMQELLAQLDADSRAFSSLKGLAKITYVNNGSRQAADHVVIARYPEQLRLETLGLFGSPMMLASSDGSRSVVLLPGEGRAFTGPAGSGFLRRVTRMPLTAKMVVSIILRRPDLLPGANPTIEYLADGVSRLRFDDGRLAQEIDFDAGRRLVRVAYLADGRTVSTLRYADYAEGFPRDIRVEMADATVSVKLAFSEVATNIDLDDALFRLVPSAAYRVEPFPDVN